MKKTPKIEIIQNGKSINSNKLAGIFSNKTNIAYISIFVTILTIAIIGSQSNNQQKTQLDNVQQRKQSEDILVDRTSVVDEAVEASVVANLAENANLAVAPNTASLSVSVSILQESSTSFGLVEKPKILEVSSDERTIKTYHVEQDQNIQEIADQYGITAQTIKWVNGLKGDVVEAGKEIRILPIDGIIYNVKSEDNIEEIAKKYEASVERIRSYNGIEEKDELKEGQEIVVPGGILPDIERPDYTPPVVPTTTISTTRISSGIDGVASANYNTKAGNAYAQGNCTWYVYNRRPDIGSFWGNASSWAASARAAGYLVSQTPSVGSIAQWNAYAGGASGWGHVAIVESVNDDGTITVTDMNYNGNYNRITTRTISVGNVSNFIH